MVDLHSLLKDSKCEYLLNNPISPWGQRGYECGKGWLGIVLATIETIATYDTEHICKIAQIKSKFGQLRIYIEYTVNNPEIYNTINSVIRTAETMAFFICEKCGNTKDITRNTNFIITPIQVEKCECQKK